MERVTGVEPAPSGWKPDVLPITPYPRLYIQYYIYNFTPIFSKNQQKLTLFLLTSSTDVLIAV